MTSNIEIGSILCVAFRGEAVKAKVRRVGNYFEGAKGFRMLTLDIGGEVAYCVCREDELYRGE